MGKAAGSEKGHARLRSSWRWLALSFAVLIMLIAAFGFTATRRARAIHNEITSAHDAYLRTDTFLRGIPTDMYLAGLLVRDYLLEEASGSEIHERQLAALRASIEERLRSLEPRVGNDATPSFTRMRVEVQAYWDSLEPIFRWTPEQKKKLGPTFLQQKVLPRWQAVVSLSEEITHLNSESLKTEQQRLEASQNALQAFLSKLWISALALGIAVAIFSTERFFVLEKRNEIQIRKIESAELELRNLSHRLVRAQEDERKFIARELHDGAGQTLTAMALELSSLAVLGNSPVSFGDRLDEIKRLNAETIAFLRDLAMGLRPSMLDDIGIEAAIKWQGRQFSRRMGVPVTVVGDGDLVTLPDAHRTCIFRVVQEALTNCGKHANARAVRIWLARSDGNILVTMEDDGIGFDRTRSTMGGLGLVSMRERVQELGGTFEISSALEKGTVIRIAIPIRREERET